MEGLLFMIGAIIGVMLWEFLGYQFAKKSKMKVISKVDYNEMKDTIEEQRIVINEFIRNRKKITTDDLVGINTIESILDGAHKAAKMSRAVSEDLLKKSKHYKCTPPVFEHTSCGPVLVREDLLKKPKDIRPSIYEFVNIECLASIEDDDIFKYDFFAVKVKQKDGIERIKKITPEEILRSIFK